MIPRDVKSPTSPIPFHKLLRIVAIVDRDDEQTKPLLEYLAAENFQIEISDSYERDVSEDADVGAYMALVDGDRLEKARKLARSVREIGFNTPLWALADSQRVSDLAVLSLTGEVDGYIYLGQQTPAFYAKQVIASDLKYGKTLLPPFFGGLMAYDGEANIAFDCPGHQGGQFYRKSPAGQLFFKHFGEKIFRNDLCNADVDLGDLLIHEGPAVEAQRHAAQVFGADKTYFFLNGTSTSNKIVTNAMLRRGDLVLFDRNNHKSLHQGALVQAGAIPIFLPTSRNAFGMIGAVDWDAWDEDYLRDRIRTNPLVKDPERANSERPFRLACIQLATYDGTIYNVRKVMEKIGHLCDYVLWDEAWIGHNAFHPLFEYHSPMRIEELSPDMPGLFSTPSVHKQGALWDRCIELGIEARKKFREFLHHYTSSGRTPEQRWFFDPFVPDVVTIRGSKFTDDVVDVAWEAVPTDVIKREQQCWSLVPGSAWHGYAGYADGYAMVDPNKLALLTPGIDRKTGEYLDSGVPATVVANYRREQRVVAEKCDLSISATLALIYPPGIGVVVPGERWDERAKPMLDYFNAFQESFNRFPGFNYEVQGVFQERVDGAIKFHTYVVRE